MLLQMEWGGGSVIKACSPSGASNPLAWAWEVLASVVWRCGSLHFVVGKHRMRRGPGRPLLVLWAATLGACLASGASAALQPPPPTPPGSALAQNPAGGWAGRAAPAWARACMHACTHAPAPPERVHTHRPACAGPSHSHAVTHMQRMTCRKPLTLSSATLALGWTAPPQRKCRSGASSDCSWL